MRSLVWAGDYPVTQVFGANPAAYAWIKDVYGNPLQGHNGLDVGLPNDTPLYAPFDCTVAVCGFDEGGYGTYVRLSWKDTDGQLLLAHLRSRVVEMGAAIGKGKVLGLSDNTGWSTGPHTHIGYRPPGWQANRANGYDGWADPYPALMGLLAGEGEGMGIVDLQGQLDQAHGITAELQRQVDALRAELAGKDSTIGALQHDVIAPLQARIATLEEALRQAGASASAARRPQRVEVVVDGQRLGYVPEAA